ncbi:methyltransferase domain-containing protein [Polynucleobacter sp. MWH-UH2A]|nr:methyltransferase domain-containing protein [Polynucleobacter sp. MWH-UH2A]
MLQKLDIVKLDVRDILVIPDFPGNHHAALAKRFPRAHIHSVLEDNSSKLQLWIAKTRANWRSIFGGGKTSSLTHLRSTNKFDIPDNSVDLIFSNLLLQDLTDPKLFLRECWRVLQEGGLVVFSYLGPDTGKELRAIQSESGILQLKNLLSPWDMHDLGDALMAEQFADPVMDMEYLTLDYERPRLLLNDVEALKLANKNPHLDAEIGDLPKKLTLEIVYGHAWALGKHLAKSQDNVAYIDVNQIGRKTRTDSH